MTNEQINRAIADVCGWNNQPVVRTNGRGSVWVTEWPDYCADLNAMHEAEKILGHKLVKYGNALCNMTLANEGDKPECYIWHATARQRAEAFLRTLGKWEEVQR